MGNGSSSRPTSEEERNEERTRFTELLEENQRLHAQLANSRAIAEEEINEERKWFHEQLEEMHRRLEAQMNAHQQRDRLRSEELREERHKERIRFNEQREENYRLRFELAAYKQRDQLKEESNSREFGGKTTEQAGTSESFEYTPQSNYSDSLELGPQAGYSGALELRPNLIENTGVELMKCPDQENPGTLCMTEGYYIKFQETLEKFCNYIISHCKRRFQTLKFSETDGSLAFFLSYYLQIESDVLRFQMTTAMRELDKHDQVFEKPYFLQTSIPLKHKDKSIVHKYSEELKNILDVCENEFHMASKDEQSDEKPLMIEIFSLRYSIKELSNIESDELKLETSAPDIERRIGSLNWALRVLLHQEVRDSFSFLIVNFGNSAESMLWNTGF
ncbi:hypothetical protein B9Z55_017148 [Caenorhabditis nigoni]|uniref:Uncharacterized protein n=1 Tax=Caenorhabditis nigoni TaxID=1611254 RepID=A0A2G5T883_9PELO|nr:hypothetical protein B9Z55_017148 [Caenorhabditis nigoni]